MEKIKETSKRNILKRNLDVIIAFFIPVVILSAVFLIHGIYPFGKHNIINSDLYLQFMPIMTELKNIIHDGGSLFYSFNGGLGTDFYVLSAYQNASPITLAFLLMFDTGHLVLAVTLMIMVKIGLISSAMYYYLKRTRNQADSEWAKEDKAILMFFAATFSLCGYVIAYYYDVMWLDSVILLPLVVLGMRRVIDGGGWKLYTFGLALLLITNYYIGAIMCIFLFMYFFVYYFSEKEKVTKKDFLRTLARVGCHSAFGVTMAMVVLLPVFFALMKTYDYASIGTSFIGVLYNSIPAHFMQLLPNSEVTTITGPPNLYSGLLSLVLFFMFILNGNIKRRKRIIKALFVLFIFVSTNVPALDLVWHFLHMPNGLPARYSIVLAFMLIEIGAESLEAGLSLSKPKIVGAFLCVTAICVIAVSGIQTFYPRHYYMIISVIMLLLLYAFVFLFMSGTEKGSGKPFIAAIILFELMMVTFRGISEAGIIETDRFGNNMNEISELKAVAEKERPYTRMEIIGTDNYNAPYVYGYKGASIFASSVPGDTFKILNKLYGDKNPQLNRFIFLVPDPVPDTLLNTGYYISFSKRKEPWLKMIMKAGKCYLYENQYHTSVGYMLPEDAGLKDLGESWEEFAKTNANMKKWNKTYRKTFRQLMKVEEMKGNRVKGSIKVDEKGMFMTTIPYDDGWSVKVDGKEIDRTDLMKYFVSFPLEQGNHSIEMVYVPKGFVAGGIITAGSLLAYLTYEITRKNKRKRQRKKHLQRSYLW